MTAEDFPQRVCEWARGAPGVVALFLIGSRAQEAGKVDAWSDWDFHLVVRNAARFARAGWPAQIGPVWCTHVERTERGVKKASVVFAGGLEADFVLLPAWQIRLAYRAMRYPRAAPFYPRALREGIANLRLIAAPGCRLLVGGEEWRRHLAALAAPWPAPELTAEDFAREVSGFWRHLAWVAKKAARGESLAAQRWHFVHGRDHLWRLLEEEARLGGRQSRPEARYAEAWLPAEELAVLRRPWLVDAGQLLPRLREEMELFRRVAARVARARGFDLNPHEDLARWLSGLR